LAEVVAFTLFKLMMMMTMMMMLQCIISTIISASRENLSVPALIPGHCTNCSGPSSNDGYLGQFKNYDWLQWRRSVVN